MPQYFENKPVEHLLGEGITADMLNDDCLGRTLDWLYEHDVTTLFAGLALQARQRFGVKAHGLHMDTTSFSVSGEYASKEDIVGELVVQAWDLQMFTLHASAFSDFANNISKDREPAASIRQPRGYLVDTFAMGCQITIECPIIVRNTIPLER